MHEGLEERSREVVGGVRRSCRSLAQFSQGQDQLFTRPFVGGVEVVRQYLLDDIRRAQIETG